MDTPVLHSPTGPYALPRKQGLSVDVELSQSPPALSPTESDSFLQSGGLLGAADLPG